MYMGLEKYIDLCARSLFEHTLDDIECILVVHGSPMSREQYGKRSFLRLAI